MSGIAGLTSRLYHCILLYLYVHRDIKEVPQSPISGPDVW
jgi:hypothetical protein